MYWPNKFSIATPLPMLSLLFVQAPLIIRSHQCGSTVSTNNVLHLLPPSRPKSGRKSNLSKLSEILRASLLPPSSRFCGRSSILILILPTHQSRRSLSSFQPLKRRRKSEPRLLRLALCSPTPFVPCPRRLRKFSALIGNELASFTRHQQPPYGQLPFSHSGPGLFLQTDYSNQTDEEGHPQERYKGP